MHSNVAQGVINSGGSPPNILESVEVHAPVQNNVAKEPPHLQIGQLEVGLRWGSPINFLGQLVQIPPGLQQSEPLPGLGERGRRLGALSL